MINGTTTRSKIGYLVVQSPRNNRAFVYADGGSTDIVGVVQQDVAPNATAQIAFSGTAKVSVVGTVQRGDIIRARKKTDKGFAGQAIRASSTETDYFRVGIALESGSGLVLVALQKGYVGAGSGSEYVHPTGFESQPETELSGLTAISKISVTDEGHVDGVETREMLSDGKEDIYINGIRLNTAPTEPSHTEGFLYWNPTDRCVDVMTGLNDSTLQVGLELWARVRNNTGVEIPNGKAVYITGRIGNRPTVALARADNEATALVLGITTEPIPHNSDGLVTRFGLVRGVDLSAYSSDDTLYLSETSAGDFTNVSPVRPNWVVKIGMVALAMNNGEIGVDIGIEYTNHVTFNHVRIYGSLESAGAKIGDIDKGDYIDVDEDGHMTFLNAATVFDDVRVPAQDLMVAGKNDPAKVVWLGNLIVQSFSATVMNELFFECQIPHGYKEGSTIYPHVHWRPLASAETAQRVRWGLEYVWQNIGEAAPVSTTTIYTSTTTPTENFIGNKHYISPFNGIDGTGKTISSMLSCRIFRDAANSIDDFTDAAGLMEIDFHVEMDTIGSNEEWIK
jgi:hypothetical protein